MPKIHHLQIASISPSSVGANSYILLMQSIEETNLSFPIVIGSQEAQSISIFLEGIKTSRPLTHDLFVQYVLDTNHDLKDVNITDFKDGIFYASMLFQSSSTEFRLDARPSDAIALAIRLHKPILIKYHLLSSISIDAEFSDDEESETTNFKPNSNFSQSKEELEHLLSLALLDEDYEAAAKIRDSLQKIK